MVVSFGKRSPGYREITVAVINIIHGLCRELPFSLIGEQRDLRHLPLKPRYAHTYKPDRLFKRQTFEDR